MYKGGRSRGITQFWTFHYLMEEQGYFAHNAVAMGLLPTSSYHAVNNLDKPNIPWATERN